MATERLWQSRSSAAIASIQATNGRHKARVFAAALGWTVDDAGRLRDMLLAAARGEEAVVGEKDEYGQRYTLDLEIPMPFGAVLIRSLWIVRAGEDFPRLASCFVL